MMPECKCIWELMEAVDNYIPTPQRATDQPFLMPVEDVFTHFRPWYCCDRSCGARHGEGVRHG